MSNLLYVLMFSTLILVTTNTSWFNAHAQSQDAGIPDPDGWYCESRNGTCWAYKDGCDDESCHWRKHAWVVVFPENSSYLAFETEQICERLRNKLRAEGLEPGARCKYLRVTD